MSYLPFFPGNPSKTVHTMLILFPPIWQLHSFSSFSLSLTVWKSTDHTFYRMTFIFSENPDSSVILTWDKFAPRGWVGLSGVISGLLKLEDGGRNYWHFLVESGVLLTSTMYRRGLSNKRIIWFRWSIVQRFRNPVQHTVYRQMFKGSRRKKNYNTVSQGT